ncbi:MAG: hypothetical protein IJT83_03915 [Victivallales bacterium]|nr:hypothetical protein [Victivallales bacterium]
MKRNTMKFRNTRLVRTLKRLLGEEKGAVAMEYIVIALLIGAAVVGIVMVIGGHLSNKGNAINTTLGGTTVEEIKEGAEKYQTQNTKLKEKAETAQEAANKLGGNFSK